MKTVHCCCCYCCLYFDRCFYMKICLFSFGWEHLEFTWFLVPNWTIALRKFIFVSTLPMVDRNYTKSKYQQEKWFGKYAGAFLCNSSFFSGKPKCSIVFGCIYLCCMCHTQLSSYAYHSLSLWESVIKSVFVNIVIWHASGSSEANCNVCGRSGIYTQQQ